MHDLDVLPQGSQSTIKGKICAEWACESYKTTAAVGRRGGGGNTPAAWSRCKATSVFSGKQAATDVWAVRLTPWERWSRSQSGGTEWGKTTRDVRSDGSTSQQETRAERRGEYSPRWSPGSTQRDRTQKVPLVKQYVDRKPFTWH